MRPIAAPGDTTSPRRLPVELVSIVRVYPGAQPYKQSAALLVYEHSGAKLRDANTQRGESRQPDRRPPFHLRTVGSG